MILRVLLRRIRCSRRVSSEGFVFRLSGQAFQPLLAFGCLRLAAFHSLVGRGRSFEVHLMWGTPLLSMLRHMSFSKERVTRSVASNGPAEGQQLRPMSDRQLALEIRQFQQSRVKSALQSAAKAND
jgi:hypothetical protein